jgi:hypothetical protein
MSNFILPAGLFTGKRWSRLFAGGVGTKTLDMTPFSCCAIDLDFEHSYLERFLLAELFLVPTYVLRRFDVSVSCHHALPGLHTPLR